jgi:hypothetical protein
VAVQPLAEQIGEAGIIVQDSTLEVGEESAHERREEVKIATFLKLQIS